MSKLYLVVLAITLMYAQNVCGDCNPPIYSFENNDLQNWQAGTPSNGYSGSASQANLYAMTQYATDGQYSLRVAFDYTVGTTTSALYFVENLNLDLSTFATLNFDIWKTGEPYSLTVALSTGDSWTWYESRVYSISDGESYLAIDLQSSDWKGASSNWANNIPVADLNAVHRIAVNLLPAATGYNQAFMDNFRLCGNTVTTGNTVSASTAASTTGSAVVTTGSAASSTIGSTSGNPVIKGFVKASGNVFMLDGCQYYIHGTNSYYITYWGQVAAQNVFQDCAAMGLNVLRTWAFLEIGSLDGTTRSNVDGPAKNGVYFQYWNTTTNAVAINDGPTGLQQLDYVLYQAKLNGVRLILTLTGNWKDFGGIDQYCVWFQQSYHDAFYTNAAIKQAYKDYVKHLVDRVNTFTGIKYRDDPTILSWELINEPRCSNGNLPTSSSCTSRVISSWINEMSTYIHSIDPNHMISVGDEGFFNQSSYGTGWIYDGTTGDYTSYTSNPYISFGTAHLYPSGWGQTNDWGNTWITQHINDVPSKPFLLEEFGITDKSSRGTVYGAWLNTLKSGPGAGFTYWMLASKTDASNLYPDYDGYTVYNDNSVGAQTIRAANQYYVDKESGCSPSTKSSTATTGKGANPNRSSVSSSASQRATQQSSTTMAKATSTVTAASSISSTNSATTSSKATTTASISSTKSVTTSSKATTTAASSISSTKSVTTSSKSTTTAAASTQHVSSTSSVATTESATTKHSSTRHASVTASKASSTTGRATGRATTR